MRKNMLINQCFFCRDSFQNTEHLVKHLSNTQHITKLPLKEFYHSPEYYFPTLDDDCFLMFLDDCDDNV